MSSIESSERPILFSPFELRSVTLRNRLVVPPMCQYSAHEGVLDDWHLVHLGKYATGGMGAVFTEATAVTKDGRITHGDAGLWGDHQIASHARIAHFISQNGAVPAVQLGHAGRKASMQRPWFGNGPLNAEDFKRGDHPWRIVAPSAIPVDEGWMRPDPLTTTEIADLIDAFAAAARRAYRAGYRIAEVHGAHGYLIQSFLSPIANKRNDGYGGDLKGRMRFALEVTEAVRAAWPDDLPLFFRVSAVDGVEGGWTLEETVELAKALKALGTDVIDCSSGGVSGSATAARQKRKPGFQVPYAETVRHAAKIATQAVGLITHPQQAEEILLAGQADLIAVGRDCLANPNWALHALETLGSDAEMARWPEQYGWWLIRRQRSSEFYVPQESEEAST